jgi:hypothetical protein
MTGYAALLVHAEPDEGAEARLRLASDLADRFGAVLIGLASGATIPPPVTAPVLGRAVAVEVLEAEQQRVEAGLRVAHERFRAAAGEKGRRTGGGPSSTPRPTRWRARPGRPTSLSSGGTAKASGRSPIGRWTWATC